MRPLAILAIDDDRLIGALLGAFVQHLGHSLVHALSGEQGLVEYRRGAFDLVLVDRQMPGLDGLATTQALRELQQDSGWRPIIMLSASAATDEQVLALNAGCDDFIAKPVNLQIIEAKINAFWRIARMQQQIAGQHQALLRYSSMEAEERRICAFLMERLVRRELLDNPLIRYLLQPASEVSGDLLLASTSRSGDLYVMLADATGHGLPAALTLIPLSQAFYTMAAKGFQLASIARELNRQHRIYSPPDRFVAAMMAVYSPRESTLEVWNGGLPEALLMAGDSRLMRSFRSLNLPLGILPDGQWDCETETVRVSGPCHLLLYSDGLIEAESPAGEPFGTQRLLHTLAAGAPQACLERVQCAVQEHLAAGVAHDDLSCLLLDCRAPLPVSLLANTQVPAVIAEGWQFNLTLGAAQLRRLDVEPLLSDFCHTLGLNKQHQGPFSLIVHELLANALDHGLLGLGSELKNGLDGFEHYLLTRHERLQNLTQGQIELDIRQTGSLQGNCLRIEVIDSGPGYDWVAQQQARSAEAPDLYHGRGLQLVSQLCDSLEICGRGNQVIAQLRWGQTHSTESSTLDL